MGKADRSEITLTDKQLKGLEVLGKIDVDKLDEKGIFGKGPVRVSWVGRMFQWIDINILDKTSRLWMYALEAVGVVLIFIVLDDVRRGLGFVSKAPDDFALKKAQLYINSLVSIIPALAAMVATICGALPTVIAVFRSLNQKWKNGNGNGNGASTLPGAPAPVPRPAAPTPAPPPKEPKSDVGSKIPPIGS